MSIKILEGDEGIIELLRDYKGYNVISIYIEEKSGPLLSIDASGNILNFDEHVPLLQYSVGDAGDEEGIGAQNEGVGVEEGIQEGAVGENESVGVEEGVENEAAGVEEGIQEGAEGENESVGVEEGVENEAAGVEEGAEGENESVGVENEAAGTEAVEGEEVGDVTGEFQTGFEGDVGTGVENEVQNDESESNSNSSLVSDCPSWMLEDLEGPWDDDIFTNRPENYTRTMLKTLRVIQGQLLAAIGRDPNDNIYPIAVAYVEVEKYDSWEWFLNLLLRDIGSHNERGWAFISDRQKGLLEAIAELAPGAEHRFCLRHMYNNFKGKFKGQELKKMFWKAASTYNVNQHLKTMAGIQNIIRTNVDKDPTPHMVHQDQEGLVPHPFLLLMRMRQYNQRYLQFFPNDLMIHSPKFQLSPMFQFSPSSVQPQVPSYDPPPQTAPRNPFKAIHSKKTTQQSVQQQHPQSSGLHQQQPKALRKQKKPISLSSKLLKRQQQDAPDQSSQFKTKCCAERNPSISSLIKGLAKSYKPQQTKKNDGNASGTSNPT
ncbi:hypothetical protein Sango_2386200 [Sesamum angolense]|uniref:MULE transposase domain-containing protein n=1 Tax=Sesamum angolense TaxID=2727404 RepID=A0AAE1W6T5_9LAMI|nr:hypothetical protein Sango_2386200 [Sesamum angolense]